MANIYGDISGIRKKLIKDIESLYDFVVPADHIVTEELAAVLAQFTTKIKREIAVYINRRGKITAISVGDLQTVPLPDIDERKKSSRLSGIRCIHTHPNESSLLSEVDISALKLKRFDLVAAIAISDGRPREISFAYLTDITEDSLVVDIMEPMLIGQAVEVNFSYLIKEIERHLVGSGNKLKITEQTEKVILAGIEQHGAWDIYDSLRELAQLTETAGAEVVGTIWQKKSKPDTALFFGKGKVQEISMLLQTEEASCLIIDDEITPAQQRNLEQILKVKVLDRTALILDIFAQRARTYEGKLQVELAQLQYRLPRLGGQGLVLSRLGGGIGTRGPGETKLEIDKRRIRERISDICREIDGVKKQRELHRKVRQASQIPTIALVGYTNAGKSTLLNKLTDASVFAEDKLFATLDPTTRKIKLPNGMEALLTDTVGFIQKLPHHLIAAFRATLEEVVQADLLLHVIDISHPQYKEQSDAVYKVLGELGAVAKPIITVLNKVDRADSKLIERLSRNKNSVSISALFGLGINELIALIQEKVKPSTVDIAFLIPYNDSGIVSQLYTQAIVQTIEYREDGIYARVVLPKDQMKLFGKYMIGDVEE